MQPRHILIVYGTNHGQTAKIARRMADLIAGSGDTVDVERADALPRAIRPSEYDGVIVGASVNYGRHQRTVSRFVSANREALNAMPTAFFSVSGSAAGHTDAEHVAAQRCMDEFLRQSGWHPALTATIAGAIAYTKYNPFLRWMLKRISRKSGRPVDTSRDHEFTDWGQVQQFAQTFGATVLHPSEARPLPTG